MGEKLLNLALIESLISLGSLCYAGYRIHELYKNRKTEKQKPLKAFCYLFFCEIIPIYDFIRWSYRRYQDKKIMKKLNNEYHYFPMDSPESINNALRLNDQIYHIGNSDSK